MSRLFAVVLPCAVSLFANAALADSHEEKIREFLPAFESALMDEGVVRTLRNYNAIRRDMTQADIDGWERIWQAELDSNNRPLITGVVRNIAALRMSRVMRETGGIIQKINLLDERGVSVAQTEVFPTIRQNSTAQLINVALTGPKILSVSEPAFDGTGYTRQFEVVVPVFDPGTDALIGSAILVIDADALDEAYPDRSF